MLDTNVGNKTILITGATSGIGEIITKQFAEAGATVVAIGRNENKLAELMELYPNHLHTFAYDLMDLEHIEDIFQFCKERGLKLDGLLHCAGIAINSVIKTNDIAEMESTMRVNCFSFFELGKFFSMKKYSNEGGVLIAISSIISLKHDKGLSQYSASKAALNSVVKTMSKEFMKRKIRVNAILPANVRTPMFMAGEHQIEGYMETAAERQPFGFIDPEQIGYMAEFLMSDNAKYMTGELVVISGGMEY